MDSEGDGQNRGQLKLLNEIRAEALLARSTFLFQHGEGSVKATTLQNLRRVTIQYYEILREHRNEETVKDAWEDTDIDDFDRLLTETMTVERPKPGFGGHTKEVEVPLIQEVDGLTLVSVIRSLDDICKDLGFALSAKDVDPHTDIDRDRLADVFETRGHDEKAEQIARGNR